ncbi:MAG: endonuclease/exonuclease/phosphatase family protein [Anaerolineae bacterium]|nr:endonuclease/exonuclease/phosphatase family protein [Anaerolineae bacterium]
MTSNLYKHNYRVEGIIETILRESPDLVALQELKKEHVRAIEAQLCQLYPYRDLRPGRDAEGMGILSRYPLQKVFLHLPAPAANPIQIALIAKDEPFWFINAHPRIPRLRLRTSRGVPLPRVDTRERSFDFGTILELIEGLQGPAILAGDMNMTDQSQEYHLLPPHWHDVYRIVGWGPGLTFPIDAPFFGLHFPFPLFRLDYIFYRGDWQPQRAWLGKMPGSDHRYLAAEFLLPLR